MRYQNCAKHICKPKYAPEIHFQIWTDGSYDDIARVGAVAVYMKTTGFLQFDKPKMRVIKNCISSMDAEIKALEFAIESVLNVQKQLIKRNSSAVIKTVEFLYDCIGAQKLLLKSNIYSKFCKTMNRTKINFVKVESKLDSGNKIVDRLARHKMRTHRDSISKI